MTRANEELEILCPRCKTLCLYSEKNPFRPFCSRRCREADLHQWAEEDYKIPGKAVKDPHCEKDDEDDEL